MYHEFLNRANKHISTKQATSDQDKAMTKLHPTSQVKDKKSDKGPALEKGKIGRIRTTLKLTHTGFMLITHWTPLWKKYFYKQKIRKCSIGPRSRKRSGRKKQG